MEQQYSKAGIALVGTAIILVFAIFLIAGFKNVTPLITAKDISPQDAQSHIESNFAYYTGPAQAKVTVVEFFDFQCAYSREIHPVIMKLITRYANASVKFAFRQLPIENTHPVALDAARASLCAKEQNKFMELYSELFAKQDQLSLASIPALAQLAGVPDSARFSACLSSHRYDSVIRSDQSDAMILGIEGTPTFFVNGKKIEGAVDESIFIDAIDSELSK